MASVFCKVYNEKMNGWEYGDDNSISYTKFQEQNSIICNLGTLYLQKKQSNSPKKKAIFPYNISPRMAFKIHASADLLLSELSGSIDVWYQYLPSIAHSFCKPKSNKTNKWRKQFIASIERIIFRLCKGNGLSPNCTAEEVVVYIILNIAENIFNDIDLEYKYNDTWNNLPKYKFDDNNFNEIRNNSIKDEVVITCFDEDEDMSTLLLYGLHIHPSLWFIAFDENKKLNHLLILESEQNQIDQHKSKSIDE